jgi:hypothetical protein
MPRLPFKIAKPGPAKIKIVTDQAPLKYDSSKVYMQMGSALRASESAQMGMLRVARLIGDAKETKELQEAAIAERLGNIVNDIDDLERVLTKFELQETRKIAQMISAALETTRASLGWYMKFLANHSEEDAEVYKPLAARLQAAVTELVDVRKKKVDDAVKMEEAYDNKKTSVPRIEAVKIKAANLTSPVTRRNLPYPATPTPSVGLPKDEVLSATMEIIQKEQTQLEDKK